MGAPRKLPFLLGKWWYIDLGVSALFFIQTHGWIQCDSVLDRGFFGGYSMQRWKGGKLTAVMIFAHIRNENDHQKYAEKCGRENDMSGLFQNFGKPIESCSSFPPIISHAAWRKIHYNWRCWCHNDLSQMVYRSLPCLSTGVFLFLPEKQTAGFVTHGLMHQKISEAVQGWDDSGTEHFWSLVVHYFNWAMFKGNIWIYMVFSVDFSWNLKASVFARPRLIFRRLWTLLNCLFFSRVYIYIYIKDHKREREGDS